MNEHTGVCFLALRSRFTNVSVVVMIVVVVIHSVYIGVWLVGDFKSLSLSDKE